MPLESTIKKYYLYNFLKTLSFWLPIFVLYFLNNGLSYAQIMILIVIQSIFQIIFEVPSGIYADHFGRKNSLIISALLKVLCMSFYYFGNGFLPFSISAAFFGMSIAFASGSDSAFIYDSLKDLKREKEYKKIEGKAFSYGLLGMAVGSFFGGFLAEISFKIPILFTLIAFFASTIVALTFNEPQHHKKSEDRAYFKHLKGAIIFSYNHPRIKWLIVFSGLMVSAMLISHRYFQPYMEMTGIDIKYFGVIYLGWLFISALSARFSHIIENKIGEFYSLLIIPLFLGFHLIIMGKYVFIYGVLFVLFGEFTWGFIKPVVNDYLNKNVESHHRATVLSLNGFFQSIIAIMLAPIFGYIADIFSLTTALFIEGIFVLILGVPIIFRIANRAKHAA
jgi:MFS family permease